MRDIIKKILSEYITETRKPRGFWDDENNLEMAAREFGNLTDFQKKNQTAYTKALKKGKDFFNRITDHMVKPRSTTPYTDQELQDIASKYQTKKDFMQNDSGAYQVAIRRGDELYNQITSHMIPLGSKKKRMVYGYFFKDSNAVYVGLTYNIKERDEQHLVVDENSKRTSVGKFIKETGEIPELVKFTEYIDPPSAQKKEGELVNTFKNQGYLILNRAKTGSLGSGEKYTEKEIEDLLKQITNYKDLYTNHYPIYRAAKRRGKEFLNRVTQHMGRLQINWTKDKVLNLASEFNKLSDFREKHNGAYTHAKNNGYLDDLVGMFPILRRKTVDIQTLRDAASKFDTITDFQKLDSANFGMAKRMGVLDDVTSHMVRLRKKNYTDDDLKNIAQNYITTKDFYKNDMTAYRAAKRRGDIFYNNITKHFKD